MPWMIVLLQRGLHLLISKSVSAKIKRIIIDAEIHQYLEKLANPILKAAKINSDSVKLHIVHDETLNAFVTGGRNIFLHTGLLISTKNHQQLRGVLAHEIGHIAGGHLTRMSQAYRDASNVASFGSILGLAAAIAAGQPQAAATLVHGAGNIAQKAFLGHTRGQEAAADHAAAKYLKTIEEGPSGLLEFLRVLKTKEAVSSPNIPIYLRTHPLTEDRIAFFENQISFAGDIKKKTKKDLQELTKNNEYDYKIGAGDVINISITDNEDIDGSYTVSPQGDVTIPYVGQVLILDKTKEEAQQFINEVLKNYYKEPETIVKVEQYNSSYVYITGSITKPISILLSEQPLKILDGLILSLIHI